MVKAMSFSEFISYVESIKGCQFGSIETITNVRMNKTNNPFYGRVKKHSIASIQINYSYENAVNNRLEKAGNERTFKSGKLTWGEWLIPNKVIINKGKYYLRTYEVNGSKPNVVYLIDDRKATIEEIEQFNQFIQTSESSKKQENEGLEKEKQVKPNNPEFSNIKRIKINGMTIELI